MSLNNLQKNFAKHIFDRKQIAIIGDLPYLNQESLARLNIYRNNVFGGFSSVLSSIFSSVKNIVGEKKFKKLIEDYQKKYPSKSGNLNYYGESFPRFLSKTKPDFLSDLAKLELYFHNCYYASDVDDFDIENFKKLNPKNFFDLKFQLHPSCFLIKSKFPIFSIWKKNGKKIPTIIKAEFALVERANGSCEIHQLTEAEFVFLDNLAKEKTLYQTYQEIIKLTKKDFDIGKLLNKFITIRVVANFLTPQ